MISANLLQIIRFGLGYTSPIHDDGGQCDSITNSHVSTDTQLNKQCEATGTDLITDPTVQHAPPSSALPASTSDACMAETLPRCNPADIQGGNVPSIVTEPEEPPAVVAASLSKIQAAADAPLQHAGVALKGEACRFLAQYFVIFLSSCSGLSTDPSYKYLHTVHNKCWPYVSVML